MALNKILEEIKKLQPFIDEDTDSGPTETLSARRGRQRNAVEQVKGFRRDYTADLLRSAVFILTVGSEREAFEGLATTEGSCLSSDAESFFKDIAGRIHPTLYVGRGDTVSNLFDVAGRHLEDKARELGILEYPQMIFKSQYRRQIETVEQLTALVKQAIMDQVGGELVGINAISQLTDAAIASNHTATVTPVVLSTADQKFSVELISHLERLTPRVFLVIAGDAPSQITSVEGAIIVKDVNAKAVKGALKQIRSSLKK